MTWKDIDSAKVHRLFYPQVPAIITAEHEKKVAAMPAIWCMPLSFNPILVGVSIAPDHETCRIIKGAQAFGLNWLDFSFATQVGELGETSAKEYDDKLSAVGLKTVRGKKTAQPLIQNASAIMECVLKETKRTGTHELMIGEVVAAAANHFEDYWNFEKYNPMLYVGTTIPEKSWVFKSCHGETVIIPLKHQKQD